MRPDGHDIVYAGAGLLWGIITCVRGYKIWREEQRHPVASPSSHSVLMTLRTSLPLSVAMGTVTALVCGWYLFLKI